MLKVKNVLKTLNTINVLFVPTVACCIYGANFYTTIYAGLIASSFSLLKPVLVSASKPIIAPDPQDELAVRMYKVVKIIATKSTYGTLVMMTGAITKHLYEANQSYENEYFSEHNNSIQDHSFFIVQLSGITPFLTICSQLEEQY